MNYQQLSARLLEVAARLPRTILRVSTEAALDGQRYAAENATVRMRVRTGMLRSSITGRAESDGQNVIVTLSGGGQGRRGPVPYAGVQEFGATIRPRRGKYLAIPVGPALTRAGVARYVSPRDVPGLRFVRVGNHALLGKPSGRGGKRMTPWFWLVRQVRIRPKHYLTDARDRVARELPESLSAAILADIAGTP